MCHTVGAIQGLSMPDARLTHLILSFETLQFSNPTCKTGVAEWDLGREREGGLGADDALPLARRPPHHFLHLPHQKGGVT